MRINRDQFKCKGNIYSYRSGEFELIIRYFVKTYIQIIMFRREVERGSGIIFECDMGRNKRKLVDIACDLLSDLSMEELYNKLDNIDPDKNSYRLREKDTLNIMLTGGCIIC